MFPQIADALVEPRDHRQEVWAEDKLIPRIIEQALRGIKEGKVTEAVRELRRMREEVGLLLEQILTSTAETLTTLLNIVERMQHVAHFPLPLTQQLNKAITLLAQRHHLPQVSAVQRVLLVLG
jgi:uncharacterized protein YicC (UPF0701 family)